LVVVFIFGPTLARYVDDLLFLSHSPENREFLLRRHQARGRQARGRPWLVSRLLLGVLRWGSPGGTARATASVAAI